jgi:Xaa-Pro aminopeptidase
VTTDTALYPSGRLAAVADAVRAKGLDVLLLTPGPDLRYVTGYDAKQLERLTCLAVAADRDPFLLVPRLELKAAQASPAGALNLDIITWGETEHPFALISELIGDPRAVALSDRMWALHVLQFRDRFPKAKQRLASTVLSPLRMRKSAAEIAALRAAGEAIDRVHASVPGWLRAGRTEREVGARIAEAILAEGHVQVDFVIVGSGPNAASPHHEVSDRVIEDGDVVVVDIGGTMPSGYCSDCTRTYAVGRAPDDFLRYYEVLLSAQEAATASVRPGVTAESVDRTARAIIADAGYGEWFIHRTGHGIGLESHEDPYIVEGNTIPLEPGMAFSIEPGIYPGPHGARIEDIVVCVEPGAAVSPTTGSPTTGSPTTGSPTAGAGYQRMNNAPRGLIIV